MNQLTIVILIFLCVFASGKPKGWEKGGSEEHHGEEYSDHGGKGEKGSEGDFSNDSSAKGHHDKEGHSGHYGEAGGNKKSYHHDDGYYASHDSGSKGSKGSSFEDNGHFSKGHSTKGKHNIHKLDEFEKNKDFFSEDHDEAYKESHGGYEKDYSGKKGGHKAGGHYKKVHLQGDFGTKGAFEKGSHFEEDAGHKGASGHDSHYGNGEKYGQGKGSSGFKKWGHGH